MDESVPLLENQSHSLSKKRLLVIFPALALIQFTSFLDQTSISTSLPAIASALHTGASISLVGACFLITSTSIQLINGRLSDIFSRKISLIAALSIMGGGNVLSGFSGTPLQLFAARAFTGFGAGAINALVQIAIADITTLEQRGYYFGIVGAATALGNGLGPVLGGALTQVAGWRWAFWFVSPLCFVAICYLVSVWPTSSSTHAKGRVWDKLKLVDWAGALASLFGITLFLVSICDVLLPLGTFGDELMGFETDSDITRRSYHDMDLSGDDWHAYRWRDAFRHLFDHRMAICETAPAAIPAFQLQSFDEYSDLH
jgi:MFS family permease